MAAELGSGALLAKIDIESVYHLVPVHPQDHPLQAVRWKGGIYFDPVANALEWYSTAHAEPKRESLDTRESRALDSRALEQSVTRVFAQHGRVLVCNELTLRTRECGCNAHRLHVERAVTDARLFCRAWQGKLLHDPSFMRVAHARCCTCTVCCREIQ